MAKVRISPLDTFSFYRHVLLESNLREASSVSGEQRGKAGKGRDLFHVSGLCDFSGRKTKTSVYRVSLVLLEQKAPSFQTRPGVIGPVPGDAGGSCCEILIALFHTVS